MRLYSTVVFRPGVPRTGREGCRAKIVKKSELTAVSTVLLLRRRFPEGDRHDEKGGNRRGFLLRVNRPRRSLRQKFRPSSQPGFCVSAGVQRALCGGNGPEVVARVVPVPAVDDARVADDVAFGLLAENHLPCRICNFVGQGGGRLVDVEFQIGRAVVVHVVGSRTGDVAAVVGPVVVERLRLHSFQRKRSHER